MNAFTSSAPPGNGLCSKTTRTSGCNYARDVPNSRWHSIRDRAALFLTDVDYRALTVVGALPLARFYPEGASELFDHMTGARILAIGGPAEGDIEGGGLVLDYVPAGADNPHRAVFAFNESGMWVEFDGPLVPIGP